MNSGTYVNNGVSSGFNSGSSGANVYRGPTAGLGRLRQHADAERRLQQPGLRRAAADERLGAPAQPTSSFGGTPSSNAFPATPASGTGSFGAGSGGIPPVGTNGPSLPTTSFPAPASPTPFSPH